MRQDEGANGAGGDPGNVCSAAQRWTSFELLLSEGADEETDEEELEDEYDEVLSEPEESEEEYDGEGDV